MFFNTVNEKNLEFCRLLSDENNVFTSSNLNQVDVYLSNERSSMSINGEDINTYKFVYFKSWRGKKKPEIGSTIAHYLLNKGIKFYDDELITVLSGGKLLQNTILQLNNLPIVTTVFLASLKERGIEEVEKKLLSTLNYPIAVKDTKARQGESFYLLKNKMDLNNFLNISKESRNYIFQEYIEHESIYRVLIFNYKAIFCQERFVGENNISVSGTTKEVNVSLKDIPSEIIAMSEECSKIFKRNIAGIDIIKDKQGNFKILEVNPAPGIIDDVIKYAEFKDILKENFLNAAN